MRKLCVGYNFLSEDVGNIGAMEAIPRIINLNECNDGIYEVAICNESRDFETGHIDDYDFRLVLFNLEGEK